MDIKKILNSLGIESKNYGDAIGGDWLKTSGDKIISVSTVDGQEIGSVVCATEQDYQK